MVIKNSQTKISVRICTFTKIFLMAIAFVGCQGQNPEQKRTPSNGPGHESFVDDKLSAGESTDGTTNPASNESGAGHSMDATEAVQGASDSIDKVTAENPGASELIASSTAVDSVERDQRIFADPTTTDSVIESEIGDSEDTVSSSEDSDAQVILPISIGLVASVQSDLTERVVAKVGRNSTSDKVLDETNLEKELADEIAKIELSPEIKKIQSVLVEHIGRIYKNLGKEGFFQASSVDVRVGTPRSFRLRDNESATFENQEVAAAVLYHLPELAEYSQAVDFYTVGPDGNTLQKTTNIQFRPHPNDPTLPLMVIDTWVRVELIPGFGSWVRVNAKYDAVSGEVSPKVNWLPGEPTTRGWDEFKNLETEFSRKLVHL